MQHANEDQGIVSSRHLAEGARWEASELEFGLIVAHNAFTRWTLRCMTAAGQPDLSALDILVLHHVNHRERAKRLADIGFLLNVEDTHTVNYALRKLVKFGLLTSEKRGKEVFYATSTQGRDLCETYRQVREKCLIEALERSGIEGDALRETAAILRLVSGLYDQAARSAASL